MNISSPVNFIKENPIDKLNLEQAKQIYDKIVDDLNYHNFLYYVKSQPVISDYEYDLLFHYLQDLEKKFPQLIRPDSPTQRLTNQIQEQLKKAEHKYPLLSLENTYDPAEVEEKLDKFEKEHGVRDFYIEPKYDGLSIELVYENGYFKQAITRGDGRVGEDVTENAKTIKTLPLNIPYKFKLHVRGEVVVKKSIFKKINAQRESEGLETYSNPRNLASGSLRQLDVSVTASRQLDVVAYEVLNFTEVGLNYHHESLNFLENNGFYVFDFKEITNNLSKEVSNNKSFSNLLLILEYFKTRTGLTKKQIIEIVRSEDIKNLLDKQDIEFDGLVIKVDDAKYWNLIGSTFHHPKWAFAFKYPAKQVSTQLLDVELSVGRTGIITPVAILQSVEIDGVIVKRATLHNFDFIKEKDLHIQDYIWIERSGEVIPYIVGVIKERRQKVKTSEDIKNLIKSCLDKAKKENSDYKNSYLEYILKYNLFNKNIIDYGYLVKIIEIPYCPVCGGETFHPQGEVALRCINISCPAQIKERLSYFVSKNGLDIEGLSEKTIELFLNINLVKTYADIFKLPERRQELLSLPGFKEKKVENIIKAIEVKKEVNLDQFLQALGIEFVGKKTAKLIVENLINLPSWEKFLDDKGYVNFKKLMEFLRSDEGYNFLMSISGIGPKVAESIRKFFSEVHNKEVINDLLNYIKIKSVFKNKGKFFGKTFVVTGSIEGISREKISKFIESNGGEFGNQITKETTLLLVGEKPGNSKLRKAKEYNIPTYDLYKFLKENNFEFPEKFKVTENLF